MRAYMIILVALTSLLASCATTLKVSDVAVYGEDVPTMISTSGTDIYNSYNPKAVNDYSAIKAAEKYGYDSIVCTGHDKSSYDYKKYSFHDTYDTQSVPVYDNHYKKLGTLDVTTKTTYTVEHNHTDSTYYSYYKFYKGDVKEKFPNLPKNNRVLYVKDKEQYKKYAQIAYDDEYDISKHMAINVLISIATLGLYLPSIPIELIRYHVCMPK